MTRSPDRDKLGQDDVVTILLDTFGEGRRAFFSGVNPLGAQEDGVQSEGAGSPGQKGAGTGRFGGTVDRSPDYQFDSKGRITERGFIVEVRIPFKSSRYPAGQRQRWGLNVVRVVQRTGHTDTCPDVHRGSSICLGQSGTIELHDLNRGLVTEVQPVFTTAIGSPARQVHWRVATARR